MSSTILEQHFDGVRRLTFNRPDKLNAVNVQLLSDFADALERFAADDDARVAILAGAGSAFTAGGDLNAFADALDAAPEMRADGFRPSMLLIERVLALLVETPKPIIARVHGAAVGIGMSFALACDQCVAAEDAVFSLAQIRLGLAPDGGAALLLTHAAGKARAARIAMTGSRVSAKDMLEAGLISEVVATTDLDAAVDKMARQLAGMPAIAMRETKRLLNADLIARIRSHMQAETQAILRCVADDAFAARVRAARA